MEPQSGECDREPIDSRFCSARTGLTPPEALEIAEFLRKTQPEDHVETIRKEAVANRRCKSGRAGRRIARSARCPLACDDGTCVAMPVRPIQCRVHCALFGQEVLATDAGAAADGAEEGLRKAMTEAGLEEELYELNRRWRPLCRFQMRPNVGWAEKIRLHNARLMPVPDRRSDSRSRHAERIPPAVPPHHPASESGVPP